jgi:hypothetical protein
MTRKPVTNSHARSSKASPIATDISRLANITPTSSSRTGSRSGSSQFAPQAVVCQAWKTASPRISVSAPVRRSTCSSRWCESCPIAKT